MLPQRVLRHLAVASVALGLSACGNSTGLSVRLLNADQLGADRATIEASVEGEALKCGEGAEVRDCKNVVPALEARPLQAVEDVRIVLADDLGEKVVTIKVALEKAGQPVAERTGMAVVVPAHTKIVILDFAP